MSSFDYRQVARTVLAGNWGKSVGVAFVAALLGGIIVHSGVDFSINIDAEHMRHLPQILVILLSVYSSIALVSFIIGGTVQLGYARYLLKQYGQANFEFHDLFSQFHRLGQGFAQLFLRNLFTFLWSLLFIIPGIIAHYNYVMTPFIMAENPDLTAKEAINASKQLMDGHEWRLFCLELSFIGWAFLCVLTLGIGILFLNPYMNAAYAAFYRDLVRNSTYDE